jgi:hypothetical protein
VIRTLEVIESMLEVLMTETCFGAESSSH